MNIKCEKQNLRFRITKADFEELWENKQISSLINYQTFEHNFQIYLQPNLTQEIEISLTPQTWKLILNNQPKSNLFTKLQTKNGISTRFNNLEVSIAIDFRS